ncbi:MAG: EAL domain-containing protein [Pseudomonadota bacterium]
MSTPTPPSPPWTSLGKAALPLLADVQDSHARRAMIRLELAFALAEDRVGLALEPVVSAQRGLPVAYHEAEPFFKDRSGAVVTNAHIRRVIASESLSEALACAALRAAWQALANDLSLRLSLFVDGAHLTSRTWRAAFEGLVATAPDPRFRLILEVADTQYHACAAEVVDLHRQGITLCLRDTGTALKTLSQPRPRSCDILRMDPILCNRMAGKPDPERLFQAKVSLAKQFDMLVVAPGLDRTQDALAATHLGADCLAGYLYSEPDLDRVPAQIG